MISRTTDSFWKCYNNLPLKIKKQARKAYGLFIKDPYIPGLNFKRVHSARPIFSARINVNYRALGILDENKIIWFWIGSHSDYDRLVKHLRTS